MRVKYFELVFETVVQGNSNESYKILQERLDYSNLNEGEYFKREFLSDLVYETIINQVGEA